MANSGSFNTSGYDGRCLNFSWSVASQSIANNTTTINWTLKGAGGNSSYWYEAGNFKVVVDGTQRYYSSGRIRLWSGTTVASGSVTMTHNADGSRYFDASAEAGIYTYAVNCRGSGGWSLPTIPRQAILTGADNFNDTGNPKITYSNPAGNAVSSLQACIANTSGSVVYASRDISKTGTSYTFNLTSAERTSLLNACPNSKTLSVKFHVITRIGGNTFYSTLDRTMTVTNANPTFSASYQDTNSTVVGITGNNQQIVRNQSTLQIRVTNLSAKKSATISSVKCLFNGTTYTGTISGTSCTFTLTRPNVASNTTATVTVTDSRGFSTSSNLSVQVLSWVLPSAIITATRHNNYYSNTDINVNADWSSVDGRNTCTIQLRYKKMTDSSYSAYVTMQDNVSQTFTLDNEYAWNIQVLLTDKFGTTTYNLVVNRGIPIQFWDKDKSSVGFNCFPENDHSVEVENDLLVQGENILSRIAGYGQQAISAPTGDWNTAGGTKSGFYMGSNMSNAPGNSTNWFFVLHLVHNNKYMRQLAFDFFSIKIWTRRMDNGAWGSWEQVH